MNSINPYPVDSTYHECCGAIGGHGYGCSESYADTSISDCIQLDDNTIVSVALRQFTDDRTEAAVRIDHAAGRDFLELSADDARWLAEHLLAAAGRLDDLAGNS